MLLKDLENKNIAIWGLGNEGQAVLDYLKQKNIGTSIKVFNTDAEVDLTDVDVIIRSPGVSIYKPEMINAKTLGIAITTSSDLFINEIIVNKPQAKLIAISGSKGKSTCTSVLYHILQSMGKNVALGGNIGKALIALLDEEFDYCICEISSYQASDLTVSPEIVMFTNLFPEHIDWHLNHNQYYTDKLNLAKHQKENDVCFLNYKCEKLVSRITGEFYNTIDGYSVVDNVLCYKSLPVLRLEETNLNGYHNLDNFAGVLSVIKYLGLDIDEAINAIKTFQPLAHRLQNIKKIGNVTFIDDSISTAPETAIGAMKSFSNNIGIILGGYDRQQDYHELAAFINDNKNIKVVATMFQTGARIAQNLQSCNLREDLVIINHDSLEQSVIGVYNQLLGYDDSTMIFSPAAPSYGVYKNFIERGNHFIDCVNSIK